MRSSMFMTMLTVEPRIMYIPIPETWFIFNLHRRSFLYKSNTHTSCNKMFKHTWIFMYIYTIKQIPILVGPLLKANCPFQDPPHCTLPHSPSSRQYNITTHIDDIKMPESSSVGHIYYCTSGLWWLYRQSWKKWRSVVLFKIFYFCDV